MLPVQAGLYRYDEWMVQEINDENLMLTKLNVRPKSHDQVFLHNFLASVVWKVAQVYNSLLRAFVSNFIAQSCENENQCLESLAEFLQGNRAELYFASKFSKSRHSQRRKLCS